MRATFSAHLMLFLFDHPTNIPWKHIINLHIIPFSFSFSSISSASSLQTQICDITLMDKCINRAHFTGIPHTYNKYETCKYELRKYNEYAKKKKWGMWLEWCSQPNLT